MKPFWILFFVVLRKLLCVRKGDDGAALLIDESSWRYIENELFLEAIDLSVPSAPVTVSPKPAACTHMRVANDENDENVMLAVDNTIADGVMVAGLHDDRVYTNLGLFLPCVETNTHKEDRNRID